MKNLIIVIVFCLFLFTGSAAAQKDKETTRKFSSRYTNLVKNCKIIEGENGSDGASDCRGVGGYRVHVWYAAAAMFIAAEAPGEDERIQLATLNLDFDQTKSTLEWRMIGNKPFALIMRVPIYAEPTEEFEYFGKKTGEKLIVKGLRGYEYIDFEVDAKMANANVKARELADGGYAAQK